MKSLMEKISTVLMFLLTVKKILKASGEGASISTLFLDIPLFSFFSKRRWERRYEINQRPRHLVGHPGQWAE